MIYAFHSGKYWDTARGNITVWRPKGHAQSCPSHRHPDLCISVFVPLLRTTHLSNPSTFIPRLFAMAPKPDPKALGKPSGVCACVNPSPQSVPCTRQMPVWTPGCLPIDENEVIKCPHCSFYHGSPSLLLLFQLNSNCSARCPDPSLQRAQVRSAKQAIWKKGRVLGSTGSRGKSSAKFRKGTMKIYCLDSGKVWEWLFVRLMDGTHLFAVCCYEPVLILNYLGIEKKETFQANDNVCIFIFNQNFQCMNDHAPGVQVYWQPSSILKCSSCEYRRACHCKETKRVPMQNGSKCKVVSFHDLGDLIWSNFEQKLELTTCVSCNCFWSKGWFRNEVLPMVHLSLQCQHESTWRPETQVNWRRCWRKGWGNDRKILREAGFNIVSRDVGYWVEALLLIHYTVEQQSPNMLVSRNQYSPRKHSVK